MKQIFLDIQNALQNSPFTLPNDPTTDKPIVLDSNGCVFLFNDQINDLDGSEPNTRPDIPQVSFLVEFVNPVVRKQGGNGMQFAYFNIRIYIIHHFYLATDGYDGGQGDQDLTILDLYDWVYMTLQKFQPANTGEMIEVSMEINYKHDNFNYIKAEYKCVHNVYARVEPVGGTESSPDPSPRALNNTMAITT